MVPKKVSTAQIPFVDYDHDYGWHRRRSWANWEKIPC